MKEKYTLSEDGFVGYWHPAGGHEGKALIVFPGSGADYELTRKGSEFLRKAGWNCLLVGFGVIHDDALVVGTQPVVAMMVFAYSIDVAQFQTLQAGRTLYILVDAILIGTYPHAALIVNIDILGGVV